MILVQFSLVIVKHSQKFSVNCICVSKKKKENEKIIVKKKQVLCKYNSRSNSFETDVIIPYIL